MSIENLIAALPPPTAPVFAFDGPWKAIEVELGTSLPQDYKDLVRVYGSGVYLDLVSIYTPTGHSVTLIPEVYDVQKTFVENSTYPMYPKSGGLLACGATNFGHYIFWLTRGPVSEWPIVVWDHDPPPGGAEVTTFECDLTDFLAGLVRGDIGFPDVEDDPELRNSDRAFVPWPAP